MDNVFALRKLCIILCEVSHFQKTWVCVLCSHIKSSVRAFCVTDIKSGCIKILCVIYAQIKRYPEIAAMLQDKVMGDGEEGIAEMTMSEWKRRKHRRWESELLQNVGHIPENPAQTFSNR